MKLPPLESLLWNRTRKLPPQMGPYHHPQITILSRSWALLPQNQVSFTPHEIRVIQQQFSQFFPALLSLGTIASIGSSPNVSVARNSLVHSRVCLVLNLLLPPLKQGAYEDPRRVYIVMELCTGGELFDRIVANGRFSEKSAAGLIADIVGVVQHCHQLGVMHLDLKPENFLLASEEPEAPLKVTDFGLSRFFKVGEGPPDSGLTRSAGYGRLGCLWCGFDLIRSECRSVRKFWSLGSWFSRDSGVSKGLQTAQPLFCQKTGKPPFQGKRANKEKWCHGRL